MENEAVMLRDYINSRSVLLGASRHGLFWPCYTGFSVGSVGQGISSRYIAMLVPCLALRTGFLGG